MADMVWVAPPCGTAYRAREIRRGGPHGRPKPLRSDRYPEGIPGLAGVAAAKVTAANELYRHEKGKFFVVENPARSHFWPS